MSKKLTFPFEKESSKILGQIKRPVAEVYFWSKKFKRYLKLSMLVDTGADYTLLPRSQAEALGINLEKDCVPHLTGGIGGPERVYLLKKIKVKLGDWAREITVGFLERDNIPPLLGRHKFLETFDVLFSQYVTFFSEP